MKRRIGTLGKLIVIDGLDGSGKNTQTKCLLQKLTAMGVPARMVSFPDYDSDSSALVKMYLGGAFGTDPDAVNCFAASTFYAVDRYASFRLNWQKDYEAGTVILANRYTTSNAIHQLAKLPREAQRPFLDWLWDLEFDKMGLPAPDRTVLLELPVEKSLELIDVRGEKKDIHENRDHLTKARQAALFAAEAWGWTRVNCLGADGELLPIPQVTDRVWN
ncbi:MAG: thymidylate kinase, partial [Clostridia bacterium]|nr:thymidylate kinase [Clostridia bacterium]